MSALSIALIEKTGHDHGFEHIASISGGVVVLASARHPIRLSVAYEPPLGLRVSIERASQALWRELMRSMGDRVLDNACLMLSGEAELANVMQRVADLGRALPNQAEADYQAMVDAELGELPSSVRGTEVERLIRQRVGQTRFRSAMLDYWGGACAVTGVTIPAVLRASHAKPWAECESDAERLNVFNGFLLSANLDALFDRFLITFNDDGLMLYSPVLSTETLASLGLSDLMQIRWLTEQHRPFLDYHRSRCRSSWLASIGRAD